MGKGARDADKMAIFTLDTAGGESHGMKLGNFSQRRRIDVPVAVFKGNCARHPNISQGDNSDKYVGLNIVRAR